MRQRVISAIVALIITIPILIIGGVPFQILVGILGLIGMWEILRLKEIPKEIRYISYVLFIALLFFYSNTILFSAILIMLLPLILYHDDKKYNIETVFYICSSLLLLTTFFRNFIVIRNMDILLVIYLFLITAMTDTFAYVMGSKYGKRKLMPTISLNKTIEGAVYGSIFGTIISCVFYIIFINKMNIFVLIPLTFMLTIIGQIGDLVFSSIKRHFKIKDFSNVMPGHGGILDRFDSIMLVMLAYLIIFSI